MIMIAVIAKPIRKEFWSIRIMNSSPFKSANVNSDNEPTTSCLACIAIYEKPILLTLYYFISSQPTLEIFSCTQI